MHFLSLSCLPWLFCIALHTATDSLLISLFHFKDCLITLKQIYVQFWSPFNMWFVLWSHVHISRVVEAEIQSQDLLQTGIRTEVAEVVTLSLTPAFREGQAMWPVSVAWSSLKLVRSLAALNIIFLLLGAVLWCRERHAKDNQSPFT
jgi:hypothetical protein